jgi:hypothetical protein
VLSAASAGCAAPLVSISLKWRFHAASISFGSLFKISAMSFPFKLLCEEIALRGVGDAVLMVGDNHYIERCGERLR